MPPSSSDPPRPSDLPPGYDEADPYEAEDLSTYPSWWRENVETFRAAGLRPYRPSRLADDVYTQELIEELETAHDCTIRFRSRDPHEDPAWALEVDGTVVARVEQVREPAGFTRYDIDADRVRALVAEAVASDE